MMINQLNLFLLLLFLVSLTCEAQQLVVNNNQFSAFWKFTDSSHTSLQFVLSSVIQQSDDWISIAFSPQVSHDRSDMIVGFISTAGPQVLDMFSLSKSFPVYDPIQNVRNSSCRIVGNTLRVEFSRDLDTLDSNDYKLVKGNTLAVGWAFGHLAFGAKDLARFHIHKARGDQMMDVVQVAYSENERVPDNSASSNQLFSVQEKSYFATWKFTDQSKNAIRFELSTLAANSNDWVGIGFSPLESHAESDMIIGFISSTGQQVLDMYSDSKTFPVYDASQDISNASCSLINGVLTVSFTRSLDTGDKEQDFVLRSGGQSVAVGWARGPNGAFAAENARFSFHSDFGDNTLDVVGSSLEYLQSTPQITFSTVMTNAPQKNDSKSVSAPDGNYIVSWINSEDQSSLTFTMSCNGAGWLAIGICDTSAHVNNDMYVGFIDSAGNVIVLDAFSNAETQPEYDSHQDVSVVSGALSSSGRLSITFSRLADTKDQAQDYVISKDFLKLTWAFGADKPVYNANSPSTTTYQSHGNGDSDRNIVSVNLFTGDAIKMNAVLNPDLILIFVTLSAICLYAFLRYARMLVIKIRYLIRSMREPMDEMIETEENEPVNPSGKLYYRGSVAIQYQSNPDEVLLHDEFNTPISMNERYLSTKKQFGIALLSTEHTIKTSGSTISSCIAKILHTRIPKFQFSVLEALVGMSYLVLNAAFFGFIEKFPGMNGAKLWGYLASANSLLVALPATRNSVLVWFLGFPFDKTIMFHRWLGRLILLQATIHFAHYPISVAQNYVNNQWYYGLGAWIALSLIFLTSIEWIRRRYFNFFFGSHFVFFAFYILGALHSAKSFLNLAYASAAIYGLDRLIRFAWGMFPNKTVNLEVTEGSVRVTFKKRFGANYSVGQYVFLNFPQISLFEWHPFTLASGPDERYCEVLIKGLGDHTKALISAVESKKQLFIRVDGPYGNWPFTFSRYRSIVLISGGVGVTPCISLIRHLFHINRVTFEVDPFVQDVFMVWSCKNELEYSWYKEIVEEAIAKSALKRNRYPRLHLYIHMTKSFPSANEELLPFIKQGRPNLKDVFDRVDQVNSERGYSNPRSAVIACGPEAMVSEAWDETSSRTKGKTRYDFHHETFEF